LLSDKGPISPEAGLQALAGNAQGPKRRRSPCGRAAPLHLEQLIKKCGNRLQSLGREGDWWTATATPDVSHPFISAIAETPQKALQLLLHDLQEENSNAAGQSAGHRVPRSH